MKAQPNMKSYNMTQAGQILGLGPRQLTAKLIALGVFEYRDGGRLPKMHHVEAGLFTSKLAPYFVGPVTKAHRKAMVTEKGMEFLLETVGHETKPKKNSTTALPATP